MQHVPDGIRAGHWLRTTGVAASAYIAASTIEFLATAAISRVLAPDGRLFLVISLLLGLATIVLGGYFAARNRPAAASDARDDQAGRFSSIVWTYGVLRDTCSARRRFRESLARRTRRVGAFCA